MVANLGGWLLVYDTTDRAALTLAGKVKMPGLVHAVAIDTALRRLVVLGEAGIYVVDFDQRRRSWCRAATIRACWSSCRSPVAPRTAPS